VASRVYLLWGTDISLRYLRLKEMSEKATRATERSSGPRFKTAKLRRERSRCTGFVTNRDEAQPRVCAARLCQPPRPRPPPAIDSFSATYGHLDASIFYTVLCYIIPQIASLFAP
jgi:hypothetical protein